MELITDPLISINRALKEMSQVIDTQKVELDSLRTSVKTLSKDNTTIKKQLKTVSQKNLKKSNTHKPREGILH